jgi:hypothetical protein
MTAARACVSEVIDTECDFGSRSVGREVVRDAVDVVEHLVGELHDLADARDRRADRALNLGPETSVEVEADSDHARTLAPTVPNPRFVGARLCAWAGTSAA